MDEHETAAAENRINIENYWECQLEPKLEDVSMLEQKLARAKQDVATCAQSWQQTFITCLDRGYTTGDPFQDELIRCVGLSDKAFFDKFMAFNRRLVENKGREFLLRSSYEVRRRHGRDVREGDSSTEWGYVFGVLSGERLQISCTPRLTVTVPLERFVTWGWRLGEMDTRGSGPLIISDMLSRSHIYGNPEVLALFAYIGMTQNRGVLSRFLGKSSEMQIYVGDELDPDNIKNGPLLGLELEKRRAEL